MVRRHSRHFLDKKGTQSLKREYCAFLEILLLDYSTSFDHRTVYGDQTKVEAISLLSSRGLFPGLVQMIDLVLLAGTSIDRSIHPQNDLIEVLTKERR